MTRPPTATLGRGTDGQDVDPDEAAGGRSDNAFGKDAKATGSTVTGVGQADGSIDQQVRRLSRIQAVDQTGCGHPVINRTPALPATPGSARPRW